MANPLRSREALLLQLAAFPDEFARGVLAGHDDEALKRPASDGGWGVVEILPHLRDWEAIYAERMRAMVEQDRPHLPAYDDELWAIERDYRGQHPRMAFEEFRDARRRLVAYLEALPEEAWTRTGVHAAFGEISVQWLADHICDHDAEHLAQARDALS